MGWNDGGGYDCDERRRRRSSVARVREPEKREEGIGESESGPGGAWHPQGDGETGREAGGGLGVCPRAPATRLRLLARGGRRQGGGSGGLGLPARPPGRFGPGGLTGNFLLSLSFIFCSVFLLFNSFATVLN